MTFSLHLGDIAMAVLLPLSLILLIIVSDRRHDRRAIAKRPVSLGMLPERRARSSAPLAPVSNVIAFRPVATKAMHQRRR
jgi:hypothetical protein